MENVLYLFYFCDVVCVKCDLWVEEEPTEGAVAKVIHELGDDINHGL